MGQSSARNNVRSANLKRSFLHWPRVPASCPLHRGRLTNPEKRRGAAERLSGSRVLRSTPFAPACSVHCTQGQGLVAGQLP